MTFEERIQKINEVQRGWLNYFRGTSIKGKLRDVDGWLRNRLRYCIWHHWKNWSKAEITNSNKKQLKSELTLNGKERILFDWELTKTMHTHLVEPEWVDGQSLKVQF